MIDPELPVNDISCANMIVRMASGETFSLKVDTLKGSPLRPMNFDDCARKFKNCLEYSQKPSLVENSETIIDFIFNLEKKEDVIEMFDYL